jgi:DNA repair and recombination protein RAD54B
VVLFVIKSAGVQVIGRIGEGKLECHGTLVEGAECKLSGREMEIDCAISRADYLSGACFGRSASTTLTTTSSALSRQFVQPKIKPTSLSSSMPARKGILLEPVDLISTTGHRPDKNNITKAKPESTYWTAVWYVSLSGAYILIFICLLQCSNIRRKPTSAKHKKWDGDGFVSHTGEKLKLVFASGKMYVPSAIAFTCVSLTFQRGLHKLEWAPSS